MRLVARRVHVWQLLVVVAVAAVVATAARWWLTSDVEAMGSGSPEVAARWKATFKAINDPDTAAAADPNVVARRFDDGSWVFGIARGSHGDPDGGTVVLKDSTGRIRAFFGHVCTAEHLQTTLADSESLAGFYRHGWWKQFRLKEYQYP